MSSYSTADPRATIYDLSTLNPEVLERLPIFNGPGHLSESMGSACFLDPPGYPSYFVRNIYNGRGDSYERGPQAVIVHNFESRVVDTAEAEPGYCVALLRRMYRPLPIDHPRVATWMVCLFHHLRNCYVDAERPEYGRPGTLIFPVPSYKLRPIPKPEAGLEIVPGGAFDLRVKAIEAENLAEQHRARLLATPDNHAAVRQIRRVYPDYQPDPRLILHPEYFTRPGYWWEVLPEQPTSPADCNRTQRGVTGKCPMNSSWCQWCGATAEKEVLA